MVRRAAAPLATGTAGDRWLFGPMLEARLARRLGGGVSLLLGAGEHSLWPRATVGYEFAGRPHEVERVPPVNGWTRLALELLF